VDSQDKTRWLVGMNRRLYKDFQDPMSPPKPWSCAATATTRGKARDIHATKQRLKTHLTSDGIGADPTLDSSTSGSYFERRVTPDSTEENGLIGKSML